MDLVAYGEAHNKAMQGIEYMLFQVKNPMGHFKKSTYPEQFEDYYRK